MSTDEGKMMKQKFIAQLTEKDLASNAIRALSGIDDEKLARVLDAAADLLSNRGWIQGRSVDRAGRMCAVAAVSTAIGHEDRGGIYFDGLGTTLAIRSVECNLGDKRIAPWNEHNAVTWNDSPNQTAENVIDTLRDTAAWIRGYGT